VFSAVSLENRKKTIPGHALMQITGEGETDIIGHEDLCIRKE
jgi:hypothetical protein